MKGTAHRFHLVTVVLCTLVALPCYACPTISGLIDVNCDGILTLATVGDSITYGIGDKSKDEFGKPLGYPGRVRNRIPGLVIVNIGKPGASAQTIYRRAMSTRFRDQLSTADYAIVLGGVNDYWLGTPQALVTQRLKRTVSSLRERFGTVAVGATLLHTFRSYQQPYVNELNRLILAASSSEFPVALRLDLIRILLSADGLHPAPPGYVQVADTVTKYLHRGAQTRAAAVVRDEDLDQLYRSEELARGTDPNSADTDSDELTDGAEVFTHGTDPLSADTDGDSVLDGTEVALGRNPNGAG